MIERHTISWEKAHPGDLFKLEVIKIAFQNHPHLLNLLFYPDEPRLLGNADEILKTSLQTSLGESLLMQFALDVWSSPAMKKHLYAWNMCCLLDGKNFVAVMEAMSRWREGR